MAESPWAAKPAPAPSKPPNGGVFSLIYVGLMVLINLLQWVLMTFLGFVVPGMVMIFILVAVASYIGGRLYLKGNGGRWREPDRKKLGLAYTAVSGVVMALSATAGLYMYATGAMPQLPQGMSLSILIPVALVMGAVMLAALYGVTRLVLWQFVNPMARSSTTVAEEFS